MVELLSVDKHARAELWPQKKRARNEFAAGASIPPISTSLRRGFGSARLHCAAAPKLVE